MTTWRTATAIALLMLLSACGHAPQPRAVRGASSRCVSAVLCGAAGSDYLAAAKAWPGVLNSLMGTAAPLYLPTWRPVPPPGACVGWGGQAAAYSYEARIWVAPCAAPTSSPLGEWRVWGGTAQALGSAPAVPPAHGAGTPVALGHGVQAQLNAGTVVWRRDGWSFEVAGAPDGAALLRAARGVASAAPAQPVPGVAAGQVVDVVAGTGAGVWLLWEDGAWSYRIQAPDASAFDLAATLVLVPQLG